MEKCWWGRGKSRLGRVCDWIMTLGVSGQGRWRAGSLDGMEGTEGPGLWAGYLRGYCSWQLPRIKEIGRVGERGSKSGAIIFSVPELRDDCNKERCAWSHLVP